MVPNIEHIRSQLQPRDLATDCERSLQADVPVVDAWPIDDRRTAIPEKSGWGHRKTGCIEPEHPIVADVTRELTAAAIHLADTLNAPALYLLTTTAEQFFPKFGFERIARADVPATVQASVEFTSACPTSATVMRKTL